MDSIKIQKHEAMRNYKIKARIFCVKIAVYSLAAFISSLFYLCIFWFPTMKHFTSIYLPSIYSLFFSSKFIFILANFIVVILIGDSKLKSDNSVSPTDEIYHEYIAKSRGGLNHMKKQRPLSLTTSSNDVVTKKAATETVRGTQDQVLRPLKTVTSCNMILHDVPDRKKSLASDQVVRQPLKTVRSCNDVKEYCKNSMASDPVVHPLKTVRSRNLVSSNGVTDPKKKSMASKTQDRQRKTPKRHAHEKIINATTTPDDQKDNSSIISSGAQVEKVNATTKPDDRKDSSSIISSGTDVEKVKCMELRESTEEGSKGNGKEIENIDVHHDNEEGKCNGKEEEEEEEEELINVYQDHDSLQRDELNRKVEDFIARVNRRRMLEAGQAAY